MSRYSKSSDGSSLVSCGCGLVMLVVNLIFGATSVNYLLTTFLGKALPFGWAMITGLFVGEFTIPTAIVVWILKTFSII